ncbi:hypothetical protein DPEC_G00361160 [Dallia pectoralis]|uniref:Uncharacterized protein n=1 Tax=Dallia pectoralis TaxID=75939 RepID=A0ACC2F100_DALPE|nr:hypothetical protein DPEC_G00361160 [Dallia pectoralis]
MLQFLLDLNLQPVLRPSQSPSQEVDQFIFTTDKHLKCVLKKQLELWYFPPQPPNITHQPPASPNAYFLRPFCLWMPYRLWAFRFVCTQSQCNGRKLTGCGVYKTVRKVLDLDGWLSCDMKVVRLMRERTLGNSVTRLYSLLREQHSADWMARTLDYLTVCKHYVVPGVAPVKITTPPHIPVPSAQWLLTVHGYDVLFQVEDFKARITSIFGSILKMDSTKKVTKKLAGAAHGTAAWATNVGNEYGQVLITVLTDSEGEGLLNMTTGLQNRYSQAGVAAPKLLYVDRDCCTLMGKGRAAAMFSQWEDLYVRLDIWHFIRRFAGGVTSESHPLYSLFLQRLSSCIFVWCAEDAERLREAKRGELAARHITGLCDSEINKRITSKEMALHCRRQTRGAEDTERLIGELLECLINATDTMGIPLLDRDRMKVIWQTQRRHVTCIQDPPGVSLYVKTKSLTKGGLVLPVLRCARGSTSMESFHLHLNRFIPGTSASAEHFQAYLLEGLTRWNEDRAEAAALGDRQQSLHSYDGVAQYAINKLSQQLMGCSLVTDYTKPAKYTGELIGVEYLYSQTGGHHQVLDSNLGMDPDVPDGIPEEMETEQSESRSASPSLPAVCLDQEEDEYMGPDRVGGYQHVVLLAKCLVRLLEGPWISNRQANEIVALWERLRDVDKMAVVYPERFRDRVLQGRFRNSKTTVTQGKDSMQRSLLGQGSGPAQWPNISRTVEALFLELCQKHPAGKTVHGVRVNRWAAMLSDYRTIRNMVLGSPHLREQTRLQLFEVNQLTLTQCMISAREGVGPFDPADDRAAPLTVPEPSTGTYQLPADQGGQAVQRGRGATYQPPLPPQQPTTSHLVATDLPATTTALPPPVGGPTVSRTTLWRARKRLESGKAVRVHKPYMCTKCSQPKTREYGHSSFKGISFCATTSGGQTLAGWLDLMRSQQGGSTQGQ